MRSRRHFKTSKNPYRHRINKKRNKSRNPFGSTHNVSILDLENINEVLRVHKTQRAEGKGSWKIMPKDSCEVYKDRQKRRSATNRKDVEDRSVNTTDTSDNNQEENRKVQRRQGNKKSSKVAVRRRRKPKKRRQQESSISSSITTTATNSSCISSSEMDCE